MISLINSKIYYNELCLSEMKDVVKEPDKFVITLPNNTTQEVPFNTATVRDMEVLDAFVLQFTECKANYCNELAIHKANKILELSEACTEDILNGFNSTAYNGENKFYPFDEKDQANMTGMLIFTIISFITGVPFYWKAKDELISYEWTATQIFKLCVDAYISKLTKMRFYHELRYMVNQATTIEEVNEIQW